MATLIREAERRSACVVCLAALAMCLVGSPLRAQAPAAPSRPWAIPDSAIQRAAALQSGATDWVQKPYDLPALIDLAQRTNPETRVAWEAARAAAAQVGLAESAYLPQLSLEALGGYEQTPLPAPKNLVPKGYFISDSREIIPSLALKWLLFDFGRRDANLEAARADSFVANAGFTAVHHKVVLDVSQTYFALGAARGRLRAAQKALATAQTVESATSAKRDRGLVTIVALTQAQRQSAQARYAVAAAEGGARTALADLIAAIGISAATPLEVVDGADLPLPASPQQSISAAVNAALAHRPDIIAALGTVDAAEASLKAAQRAYRPSIGLSARAFQNFGSLSSDGGPTSSVDRSGESILLSFSLPLFDGGERADRISIARARLHQSQANLELTRDGVAQQVVQAYDGLLTGLAEYAAAETLRQAAHTSYDAALHSYQQGVGTYTELATEENAVADAEKQIEDAHAAAHSAAAALAFAMGLSATAPDP
jgi:outer membrane protein